MALRKNKPAPRPKLLHCVSWPNAWSYPKPNPSRSPWLLRLHEPMTCKQGQNGFWQRSSGLAGQLSGRRVHTKPCSAAAGLILYLLFTMVMRLGPKCWREYPSTRGSGLVICSHIKPRLSIRLVIPAKAGIQGPRKPWIPGTSPRMTTGARV